MGLNKDIKVALLTILTIVGMILAFLFMKGTLLHSGNPKYIANFESVDKIKKSDKVYLNGVIIGNVEKIEFADINKPNHVKVTFTADKNLKIPKDSKIQIVSTSLMGNMGLKLYLGESLNFLKEQEEIMGLGEQSMFESLGKNVEPLTKTTDSLLKNVNTLFNRSQQENFYITINQLNQSLATMNQMMASSQKPLQQTMENFAKMSTSLANKQEDINQTIRNIRDITGKTNQADIGGMMLKLNTSVGELNGMMANMNNGEGSLGKLMKDETLYNNLNTTVNNANELMIDFKANPKRYVGFSIFGGKK